MVIEDDEAERQALEALLSSSGFEPLSAPDGAAGLELLRRLEPVDLILLDLRMPGMDGWEFRVAQKADPALSATPVVVMSGDPSAKAAAIDADAFLRKPFDGPELIATVRKVLAIVERELSRIARLAQADRLASLGMLAAGVAHEINNPLSSVVANLGFVAGELRRLGRDPTPRAMMELDAAIDDARIGAERIGRIVADLQTTSRPNRARSRAVDVERVLDAVVRLMGNELRHRARLVTTFVGVPGIDADEARLGQVFMNLLLNAAHAIPEGHADRHEVRVSTNLKDGQIVVEVRDTGEGIRPEDLGRVFDPFFTTKGVGQGTGLGLWMAHQIVAAHGGQIQIESQRGRGTTVRVKLPTGAPAAASETRVVPGPGAAARAARARVLIIDDEELVARTLQRTLAMEHDVSMETDPNKGLARIEGGERFDLVLCDVMMPTLTGMELLDRLRALAPEQAERIVFLTGGAFTPAAQAFREQATHTFVDKPVAVDALRALVRDRIRPK